MRGRADQRLRSRRILVPLVAVALLTYGLLVTGGGSVAPIRAACDIPIGPGTWTGSFELDEEFVPNRFPSRTTTRSSGTLDLTLSCEGTLSGSFTLVSVTVETLDRPMPPLPKRMTCTSRGTQELTSGTLREAGAGGLILELAGKVQPGASMRCSPPPKGVTLPKPQGVVGIRLTGSQVAPGAISGGPP